MHKTVIWMPCLTFYALSILSSPPTQMRVFCGSANNIKTKTIRVLSDRIYKRQQMDALSWPIILSIYLGYYCTYFLPATASMQKSGFQCN